MKTKDLLWSVVTVIVWYFFAYCTLYVIKNDVNLWIASLLLLGLGTLGVVTCPWFQHTQAWKELMGSSDRR